MNGRLYDPVIARMLSPDPFVQAPNSLQSYNRYTYVFNNPLSYTDPSGYAGITAGPMKGFDYTTSFSVWASRNDYSAFNCYIPEVTYGSNAGMGPTYDEIGGVYRDASGNIISSSRAINYYVNDEYYTKGDNLKDYIEISILLKIIEQIKNQESMEIDTNIPPKISELV